VKVDGYFTDHITRYALEFIQLQKGNPFFLHVAYNAPHYPLEAPAELVYKYRNRFRDQGLFAIYAAMIERLDYGVGKILHALDSLGLSENTLVVICSDNGPSAEPRSYGLAGARRSAGPLRDHKFSRQRNYPNPIPHTRIAQIIYFLSGKTIWHRKSLAFRPSQKRGQRCGIRRDVHGPHLLQKRNAIDTLTLPYFRRICLYCRYRRWNIFLRSSRYQHNKQPV
jgi:hypothetical protein